jgi:hypothetical protein
MKTEMRMENVGSILERAFQHAEAHVALSSL